MRELQFIHGETIKFRYLKEHNILLEIDFTTDSSIWGILQSPLTIRNSDYLACTFHHKGKYMRFDKTDIDSILLVDTYSQLKLI